MTVMPLDQEEQDLAEAVEIVELAVVVDFDLHWDDAVGSDSCLEVQLLCF